MNPIKYIRRLAAAVAGLAALASALVAFGATPAFATMPPGGPDGAPVSPNQVPAPPPVQIHTVVAGGMPGWQIALIAVGAALIAAIAAVLVDRALGARRKAVAATA
jgi:hypothetical protein